MKKFISTERKGFKMTFENGLTISVQWGVQNYCDNKSFSVENIEDLQNNDAFYQKTDMESDTAEIAIMLDDIIIKPSLILDIGEYGSYVMGYKTPEEVLTYMNEIRLYNKSKVEDMKSKINLLKSIYSILTLYPPIV